MILPLADLPPSGPYAAPRPYMRGRYLVRDRKKAAALRAVDAVLALLPLRRGSMVSPGPERILIANWAHLGDVTTTLGALRALRERYPAARIDMLTGSWGKIAVQGTGLVDDLHLIDHWMLNRADMALSAKRARYRTMRDAALRAMRKAGYDVAIDLYPFFPVAHPLFLRAGIGVRIGYTSGGFGPLLTHPVPWPGEPRPMADCYRDLLDQIDPSRPFAPAAFKPYRGRATLPPLPADLDDGTPYIVIHPGAGSPSRLWGEQRWATVMARLRRDAPDHRLVLTGAGPGDAALTARLAAAFPGTVDMAGRAGWDEFSRIVADAALIICPDTATGHVAALFAVPSVVIFTGTNDPARWAPWSPDVAILTRPVRCAPCNRTGCEAMACFLDVPPDAVADAALVALRNGGVDRV